MPVSVSICSLLLVGLASVSACLSQETTASMIRQRADLDATVWKQEVEAQEYESTITRLWDKLRATDDAFKVFSSLPIAELIIGPPTSTTSLDLGIRRITFGEPRTKLSPAKWRAMLKGFEKARFEVVETEWHHSAFRNTNGSPTSDIAFVLHVFQRKSKKPADDDARLILRGTVTVEWGSRDASVANEDVPIKKASVQRLELLSRLGRTPFQEVFSYQRRNEDVASAHPIIVYDLDGNLYPEIIISRWNRVYWNQGKGKFKEGKLFDRPIPLAEAGLIADVNGDNYADFVSVNSDGRLAVFHGTSTGAFPDDPVIASDARFPNALAITAGDIDRDSDIDLWVSQYKPAYLEGQMPTPYYDANDGEPGFLLVNDGAGRFTDETQKAGLNLKRNRRTYSSSFVDLDQDCDLDLLKVSDYAGVDIFTNDGKGKFRDATNNLIDTRHLFGMAHTVADFDANGSLDVYAIGMSSTTARRLDAMALGRKDRQDIHSMRSKMGYGNRMYCFANGKFQRPVFAEQVARTGWSWGSTAFDFDLDGDRDIYVANGFRSGESCQDYCSTFWRHDIYTGASNPDADVANVFINSMQQLNAGKMSWNGYEHNALLLNGSNRSFANVGFLLGVGCEFDSRVVIGTDLDMDGSPDLIVSEYEFVGRGFVTSVHVFRNRLRTDRHWIGLRLTGKHQANAFGAKAAVTYKGKKQVQQLISGDSFLSQHPPVFHFGLGEVDSVEQIEVSFANGTTLSIPEPKVDRYHVLPNAPR